MFGRLINWREFGLGVLVGASGTIIANHVINGGGRGQSSEVQQLAAALRELQREWQEIRVLLTRGRDDVDGEVVEGKRPHSRPKTPGARSSSRSGSRASSEFISIHGSSGSEEEDFEEAYEYEGYTTPSYPLLYKDAPEEQFQSLASSPEQLTAFFTEIDGLFAGSQADRKKALQKLQAHEQQFSSEKEFMWRLARAKVLVSEICRFEGDEEERKRLVYEARDHALATIDLDEGLSHGHKYYAVSLGVISDFVSFSEKASLGKLYKQHIERALELRPDEAFLNHLYGRFLFEIANLGWLQRKAAISIYGMSSSLSVGDALVWFEKAEEIEPGFSNMNPFFIAKCYIANGRTGEAVEYLEKTITFKGISFAEEQSRVEAKELLQQYK